MTAHTPGPWSYPETGCNVGGPDRVRVADCFGLERSPEERQANCRLIAAAPDLAELLLLALPAVEESEQFDKPRGPKLSGRIRELLARAGVL